MGVYRGNASFIGSAPSKTAGSLYKPTQPNGTLLVSSKTINSVTITIDNSDNPVTQTLNTVLSGGEGGGSNPTCDPACASTETCTNGTCMCGSSASCTGGATCVNNTSCVAPAPTCGSPTYTVTGPDGLTYGTVRVVNGAYDKCWLDRNLGASRVATSKTDTLAYGHYYQWGRSADGHQLPNSVLT